jgi:hypothetical protein
MNEIPKYRILFGKGPEDVQAQINQLNGYRAINITASEGFVMALMEYERPKHNSGEFDQQQIRL